MIPCSICPLVLPCYALCSLACSRYGGPTPFRALKRQFLSLKLEGVYNMNILCMHSRKITSFDDWALVVILRVLERRSSLG